MGSKVPICNISFCFLFGSLEKRKGKCSGKNKTSSATSYWLYIIVSFHFVLIFVLLEFYYTETLVFVEMSL